MNLIQNYLTESGCYKAGKAHHRERSYDPFGGMPAAKGGCVHEELEQG